MQGSQNPAQCEKSGKSSNAPPPPPAESFIDLGDSSDEDREGFERDVLAVPNPSGNVWKLAAGGDSEEGKEKNKKRRLVEGEDPATWRLPVEEQRPSAKHVQPQSPGNAAVSVHDILCILRTGDNLEILDKTTLDSLSESDFFQLASEAERLPKYKDIVPVLSQYVWTSVSAALHMNFAA